MLISEFKIDFSEIKKLAKKFPQVVQEESQSALNIIVARLESEIVQATPQDLGTLRKSISGEAYLRGQVVEGVVGTPLEYSLPIEMGRRPGQTPPPVKPIELWVQRKMGLTQGEAKSVAFLVARSIGKKGFKGAHMFEKTFKKLERWIMGELRGIPVRVANRCNNA